MVSNCNSKKGKKNKRCNNNNSNSNDNGNDNQRILPKKALNKLHELFVAALFCVCLARCMGYIDTSSSLTKLLFFIVKEYIDRCGELETKERYKKLTQDSQKKINDSIQPHIATVASKWILWWDDEIKDSKSKRTAKKAFVKFQTHKCERYVSDYKVKLKKNSRSGQK